jgi:pSer/pThr/pTyr-binding forkhead associated (FHA) protein
VERHARSPAEIAERLEAERQGRPYLCYRDGAGTQQLVPLDRERVSIGRREEADVALIWDDEASRLHALLERVGGEWTVVDDGLSANGTFVGTARITGRRRLVDGDELRCGRTRITFADPAAAAGRSTEKSPELATVARITDAQMRVLVALCRPYANGDAFAVPATNRQIADELFLSVEAVKSHLRPLFEKFALGDLPQNAKRAALVERALTLGIVTERDLRAQ